MSIEIRNNVARVAKVEITRAGRNGAYLGLQLHIELTAVQLKQFVEGRYAVSDQAVYGALYAEWERKYQEAERNWQDRTNAIMHEYNLACEDADERGKPRPSPPKLAKFIGPAEPEQIKASRPCKSLKEWYVHVHAELVDEDQQIQRVELGASTKGTPRLTTEGALALLEMKLDERYCEHTAEKDEVWEWLQLAGQEFRVFGAQLTIDDVLDEEEAEEVVQPQLGLERLNTLAASVERELGDWRTSPEHVADREVADWRANTSGQPDMSAIAASVQADMRAKGHDVAVEAVAIEQSRTLAQRAAELGMCGAGEYIEALRRTGFEGRIGPVTRITQAQHRKVLEELGVLPRCDIGQIMESVKFEMPQPVDVWAKECDVHPDTYASAMTSAMGISWESARAANLTRREHEIVRTELATWVPDEGSSPGPLERALEAALDLDDQPEDEDADKTAAYWSDIAGVPQDDYMTALQALEPWSSWESEVPAELHEKVVGLLEQWAKRDSKRDEQSEAERRDFGVCKTANTWAREAGVNGKSYVRTAISLGVFPDDASPVRVKFNENTHLRIMAAMSGEQPAA